MEPFSIRVFRKINPGSHANFETQISTAVNKIFIVVCELMSYLEILFNTHKWKSSNKIYNFNIGDNAENILNDVNYVKKNHFNG